MLHAPAGALVVTTPRGSLEVWQAAPGVVIQRTRGHATIEISHGIKGNLEKLIAAGVRPVIFNDWEELEGYTSEARSDLTQWTAVHLKQLAGINILVRSKLVAMGVAVANLAVGGMNKTFAVREDFERAIEDAVRESKRRTSRSSDP